MAENICEKVDLPSDPFAITSNSVKTPNKTNMVVIPLMAI